MYKELLENIKVAEINCEKRQSKKIMHPISEILLILVIGFTSGCNTINAYYTFALYHEELLKEYLPFINGIPSNDTIYRVLSLLDKKYLEHFLSKWYLTKEGDIIAIDGKTIKGSKKNRSYAKHVLSAYSTKNKMLIAQITVTNKNYELNSILKIIEMTIVSFILIYGVPNPFFIDFTGLFTAFMYTL